MQKMTARAWSAMRRMLGASSGSLCGWRPLMSAMAAMTGWKMSMSKLFSTPCITRAMRSRPMPVSMFCMGRGGKEPSGLRSNCWKTRFQTST